MRITGLMDNSVSFLIGGEAGQGITRSGSLLGKALMRGGFHVFGANDYPSVIRGSHNFYVLRVSDEEIWSQGDSVDLLLALNKETILLHEDELTQGGGIVYDEQVELGEEELERDDIVLFPFPLTAAVEEMGGIAIMRNTVALGAALGLVGYDKEIMKGVIADTFAGRDRIIEMNRQAIYKGHAHAREPYDESYPCRLEPSDENPGRILPTGNDAVALGAISAGCKLYAAYPMTPASPVLHYLAAKDEEAGMAVVQTESEISAVNMVVGASYAGIRAMTATSGGGFCLMTEALGLAGMTETPLVLMVVQRPGPSTGLATYTSQGDLLFAIHASQGEFPRVIVAPGDVEECFYLTMEAFNLAERFQVQSLILTDKYLIESHKSTEPFDSERVAIDRGDLRIMEKWREEEEYRRYKFSGSGVSPRILPGTRGATVLANSNEHTDYGYTTSESEKTVAMVDKRFRKQEALREEVEGMDPVKTYGDADAQVTLVGWGSTKGPALEALKMLGREGVKARFVQVVYLEPFPSRAVGEALEGVGRRILVEANRTAQLGKLIKLHNGLAFEHVFLKYDGRPFNPGEIYAKAREALG
ncbi:MAG: 2-oxoacid:acceptor oxidoreductase subunit alpha [Candidatus Bathyarchaeota archaeon]|nr:MAG: 2-oxoacid:acceptor oxidoreductase subunit alpha [Candidatus Bathyarchaeota archaeon]